MASVSPKHDTHPLIVAAGQFSVSILAGDQVDAGQYFCYPGRRFRYIADEYLEVVAGDRRTAGRAGRDRVAALRGVRGQADVRPRAVLRPSRRGRAGRLREPPLLYWSRLGWRVTGDKAREPGRQHPRRSCSSGSPQPASTMARRARR